MPSSLPRVQVTVDPELAAAMAEIDPHPASRSRLIRDLAMRGAQVERDELRRRESAAAYLLRIARGEAEFDFDAARAIHRQREADFG